MEKSRDSIKGTIQHLTLVLHEKGLQQRIRSISNQTQSPSVTFSEPLAESLSDDSAISYASTSPEPKPVPPPRRCNKREFCQTCRYPIKYDHVLWAMGQDDYNRRTCRCAKTSDETPDPETPITPLPEVVEPRPSPATPHCKKCDASHIKRYCPEFTCPYCWTTAPGHWPNKCPKKTFQKYWWKRNTKRSEDRDSTQSWDDCCGFYDISGEEDGNLNGEC